MQNILSLGRRRLMIVGLILMVIIFISILLVESFLGKRPIYNLTLHNLIETSVVFVCFLCSYYLFINFINSRLSKHLALVLSFLLMGIYTLLHRLAIPDTNNFILFYLLSGVLCSLGFVVSSILGLTKHEIKTLNLRIILILILIVLLTSPPLLITAIGKFEVLMISQNRLTNVAIILARLSAGIFLAAAWLFYLSFKKRLSPDDFIFFIITILFSIEKFSFSLSGVWDSGWWYSHFLRLIFVSLLVYYLFYQYSRSISSYLYEIEQRKKAESELLASEQQLRAANQQLRASEQQLKASNQQLRATEQQLRASNQQLRASGEQMRDSKRQIELILGATNTGLDIIDSEYNIRYIDPEWQKVYGDPAGKKCYEYFMDRSQICPGCGVKKTLETKKIMVTEEVLIKERNRPTQVTTIPFQNENKEWLVAEVNVDITERKKAELELREAFEQLKETQDMLIQSEKLASLGGLVMDMAHEVNNPLMIISGRVQLSLMEDIKNEEVLNNFKIIEEQCNRAKSIIQRLLVFSRPSKGEVKKVDINETLELVIKLLEHQFSLNDIKIIRNYFPRLALIEIDEKQIHEVFMNLLNNSAEAMPKGGTITVSTSQKGDFLCIDFKDTGIGIAKEDLKKILDPFFTTKESGTGLGLSVCYGIIRAHNGQIKYESKPSEGTTASILLPKRGVKKNA